VWKEELFQEGVLAKFLRYVRFDTRAFEGQDTIPSSPGQLALANRLRDELSMMGLEGARVDGNGFVTATLPGIVSHCPVIGFLAHMDTAPGVPGDGVRPIVHQEYRGGDISLPSGQVIRQDECKSLARVIGHTLVTSDGNTLLGADDKAGIAVIMEALCRLLRQKDMERGTIRVSFTPDEEIGAGIGKFKVEEFGADLAYTVDGGAVGEIEDENFNASNYRVLITGRSTHTGAARNAMINALHRAGEFLGAIPATMRPETTDDLLGFIHPDSISGNVEKVEFKVLARDFTEEGLASKEAILQSLCDDLMRRYPCASAAMEKSGGYRNMNVVLKKKPKIVRLAREAVKATGTEPVMRPVRGGTDGAHLTAMGLPTPNLFTGGVNFHSRVEWVSVQWMEKAVETLVALCGLWAKETSAEE